MKDLTAPDGIIDLICNADRPIGREMISIGEITELRKQAEKEGSISKE